MKNILLILLILVCIFSLFSLTLGQTVDGYFTGVGNTSSADDYGQFMDSFASILNWFNGIGTFFKSTLAFIRDVGIGFANAWEAVETWIANTGADLMSMLENIFKFFGWVNNENPNPVTPETPETPEIPENSAFRSRSKEVLGASLTDWSLALITTPRSFSTLGKDMIYAA